jgi:hypothetical protein
VEEQKPEGAPTPSPKRERVKKRDWALQLQGALNAAEALDNVPITPSTAKTQESLQARAALIERQMNLERDDDATAAEITDLKAKLKDATAEVERLKPLEQRVTELTQQNTALGIRANTPVIKADPNHEATALELKSLWKIYENQIAAQEDVGKIKMALRAIMIAGDVPATRRICELAKVEFHRLHSFLIAGESNLRGLIMARGIDGVIVKAVLDIKFPTPATTTPVYVAPVSAPTPATLTPPRPRPEFERPANLVRADESGLRKHEQDQAAAKEFGTTMTAILGGKQ